MSFSNNVKLEISQITNNCQKCDFLEFNIILYSMRKKITEIDDYFLLEFQNKIIASRFVYFFKKFFKKELSILENCKNLNKYNIKIKKEFLHNDLLNQDIFSTQIVLKLLKNSKKKLCCKRVLIRTFFIISGSLNDPEKSYHFEIIIDNKDICDILLEVLKQFEIVPKILTKKNNFIIYIKEGEKISNLLNIMGAHISLLNFENIRIVKDLRNNTNRIVNCETYNISKTVSAAFYQISNIKYIYEKKGYDYLPMQLKEVADIRLKYPEATLKEIGMLTQQSISKSGVNHRLRKINEIAQALKGGIL